MEPQSASRRYVLFYAEVELGEVVQRDADFPNCSGTWTPSPKSDNPEIRSFKGVKSDFCFIRAFGRSPKPAWAATLGQDFVTEVSDA